MVRFSYILFFIIAFFFTFFFGAAHGEKKTDSVSGSDDVLKGQAELLFATGKYDGAIEYCDTLIDKNPSDAYAYMIKGICYFQKLDIEKAETNLKISVAFNPHNAVAQHNLATVLYWQKDIVGALGAAEKAVELKPHNLEYLLLLGKAAADNGKAETARVALDKYIKGGGDNPDAYVALAKALKTAYRYEEALKYIVMAMEADIEYEGILAEQAQLLENLERYDEASDIWYLAIKDGQCKPVYLKNMGIKLVRQGKYDEAITALKRLIALDPNDPSYRYNIGLAYEGAGNDSNAEAHYKAAIKIDPDYLPVLFNYAVMLDRTNRDAQAEKQYTIFVDASENNENWADKRSQVINRLEEGTAYRLDTVNSASEQEFVDAYNNAVANHNAGNVNAAIAGYREALAIDPAFPEANLNIAVLLDSKKLALDALPYFRKFIECASGRSDLQETVIVVKERIEEIESGRY